VSAHLGHVRRSGARWSRAPPSACDGWCGWLSVAVEQVAEAAEDRAFFAAAAAGLRGGGVDAARESAERQRLEPHASGSAQRREEQAFAAEQRGLDPARELD